MNNKNPVNVMRLDKFIAHSAGLSRTDVKRLLRRDLVTVNGSVVRDPTTSISPEHSVLLDDELLRWPQHRYLMLNKPQGYVCSTDDASNPVVHGLVDEVWAEGLHCAGRLDTDTTGLVLMTDDGDWSHAVTSPKKHCIKTYYVELKYPLTDDIVEKFAHGLMLNGESKPTLPAQLEILDTLKARVRISEGRYHQIKRMFAACSNRVERLHREAVGAIVLDSNLKTGEWRELSDHEVRSITDV